MNKSLMQHINVNCKSHCHTCSEIRGLTPSPFKPLMQPRCCLARMAAEPHTCVRLCTEDARKGAVGAEFVAALQPDRLVHDVLPHTQHRALAAFTGTKALP